MSVTRHLNQNRYILPASVLAGFLLISPLVSAFAKSQPVISRITIRGTDIFDFETNTSIEKFPYTWINFLHIQTKESVIRRALLFSEGERLDPFLLRETERNLRALSFIRAARIITFPQRDGSVVVVVHVNDGWTTEPQINISGTNGIDKVEIGFKEKNFLGLGKTVQFFNEKNGDITTNTFGYNDPQLFGSRWTFDAQMLEASNGNRQTFKLDRPFYSADTRWSVRSAYDHDVLDVEQFINNVKVSEYQQTKESGEAGASLKLGKSRDIVNHMGLRYRKERIDNEPNSDTKDTGLIPNGDKRQTIFLDADTSRTHYIELTQLEKMTRIEDVNLGAKIAISPGYSPEDLTGKEPTTSFEGSFEKYTEIMKQDMLYTQLRNSSRDTFGEPENVKSLGEVKYYFRKWNNQTWVFHNRFEWGHRLDPDNLIELGSQNGLRAFKNVAFVGTKSILVNLEDRIYFIDDLWDLLSVGGAVFFDSGYVWDTGQAVSIKDMKSDAGVGLRLGLTRASNEVIVRCDAAYRMQTINGEKPQWVFSFGTGQAF